MCTPCALKWEERHAVYRHYCVSKGSLLYVRFCFESDDVYLHYVVDHEINEFVLNMALSRISTTKAEHIHFFIDNIADSCYLKTNQQDACLYAVRMKTFAPLQTTRPFNNAVDDLQIVKVYKHGYEIDTAYYGLTPNSVT